MIDQYKLTCASSEAHGRINGGGGGGGGHEKIQNIGFLSITDPDRLKITKLPSYLTMPAKPIGGPMMTRL